MSNFLYFIGGCTAGALAVVAVQAFAEENTFSYTSSSSCDDTDETDELETTPYAQNEQPTVDAPDHCTVKTQAMEDMEKAMSATLLDATANLSPDMQKAMQ